MYVVSLADEALLDGNPARAEQQYERYLAEYPTGRLIPEATMGLLQARFARGDAAGAETLAKKMQGDPTFSEDLQEILRFRAESLVQLDRCGEALLLAEELSARSAAPVKRACRHREGD
jgi:TolA-binding protein